MIGGLDLLVGQALLQIELMTGQTVAPCRSRDVNKILPPNKCVTSKGDALTPIPPPKPLVMKSEARPPLEAPAPAPKSHGRAA